MSWTEHKYTLHINPFGCWWHAHKWKDIWNIRNNSHTIIVLHYILWFLISDFLDYVCFRDTEIRCSCLNDLFTCPDILIASMLIGWLVSSPDVTPYGGVLISSHREVSYKSKRSDLNEIAPFKWLVPSIRFEYGTICNNLNRRIDPNGESLINCLICMTMIF